MNSNIKNEKASKPSKVLKRDKPVTVIIMAAGQGTRMKSGLPKVLHPLCGRPLMAHVVETCKAAGLKDIRIVIGHQRNLVHPQVEELGAHSYVQSEQKGTGHAAKCALPDSPEGHLLILNGDHPLIQVKDLKNILEEYFESKWDLMLVTTVVKDPGNMGRVVRSQGQLAAIVEAKDASSDTLKITEINTGIYLGDADVIREELENLTPNNAQGEYYLTDVVRLAIEKQYSVGAYQAPARVGFGVNTQKELAQASRILFKRKVEELMENGVIVLNPKATYVEVDVQVSAGSVLFPNVMLRGKTQIGKFCAIESNCMVVDSEIGDGVQLRAGSYIEQTKIHSKASIGPYARLRPETEIGEEAHVGNFVEMKKVKFGKKSKAGHLTYLGDAEVGNEVNIGCGTITCNFAADRKKYKTVIGDRVFVGSDTQFVAPVQIGADSIIGSGSTITKNVPAGALAFARSPQTVKEGYAKKFKLPDEPPLDPIKPTEEK